MVKYVFEQQPIIQTKIEVYLSHGVVCTYMVDSPEAAREHAWMIIKNGYRHTPKDSDDLVYWPPHKIEKVKVKGAGESTNYKDTTRAT